MAKFDRKFVDKTQMNDVRGDNISFLSFHKQYYLREMLTMKSVCQFMSPWS